MDVNNVQKLSKNKEEYAQMNDISSAIMMRLPAVRLNSLRKCFETIPEGLNLIHFLESFVQNMDLRNEDMLLKSGKVLKIYVYIFSI